MNAFATPFESSTSNSYTIEIVKINSIQHIKFNISCDDTIEVVRLSCRCFRFVNHPIDSSATIKIKSGVVAIFTADELMKTNLGRSL